MRRGLYRLNSTVLCCRLNALNCISSRRSAGKLYHTRGPATEKLLSPKVLHVPSRFRRRPSNIFLTSCIIGFVKLSIHYEVDSLVH